MKLICVDNRIKGNPEDYYFNLTIGNSYEILGLSVKRSSFKVKDDFDHVRIFPKDCFKTLDEIRDEKINTILDGK